MISNNSSYFSCNFYFYLLKYNDFHLCEKLKDGIIELSKLVIVESPAKAKTIKKYLGSGFEVTASMGHIRDLPQSRFGVDVKNNFKPEYIPMSGKNETIKKLKQAAAKSDFVYLATDPDREGEAISWHLAHVLGIDGKADVRITFNEITENAVKQGVANPRAIDENLVNAQQARRILDRLVGYKISPFLWKKIKKGLSAGRVQSVATRLIVDREREITAFVPKEYWNLTAFFFGEKNKEFSAKFHGTKKGKLEINEKEVCDKVLSDLENATYSVDSVKKGEKTRQPSPPFITSTLQQEASRRFGMSSKSTMRVAQQLYEGVELENIGLTGLITYMRTDSLRISNDALTEAREFINNKYGADYCPKAPRVFKSKKNSQDAHEAIRPSIADFEPDKIKASLTAEQLKIYRLIWERFMASQMSPAVYETISTDIEANGYIFKAADQKVKFAGFTALYEEFTDENKEEEFGKLPPLKEGDVLKFKELKGEQKFTLPPARYTEATLIKALEENGIGRPSTYAPTISTIMDRGYVEKDAKLLKPTPLGEVTTDLMLSCFSDIVDVEFTADMEEKLDKVELGAADWVKLLDEFYTPFEQTLSQAEEKLTNVNIKVPVEESDVICDKCGRNMVIKQGRYGKFLACPGYPDCKNAKPIVNETDGFCPKCGGKVLAKKSKKGKKYFGCEHNPKCDFMTWDEPTKEKCPNCEGTLYKKTGKVKKIYCLNEECGYEKDNA